ncbi:hypothetical protein PL81_06860 [Streptomyces sp. RSD-27]|nr:hypothetical protein PL81_06860 [Streptomyces sp. RSD-27]
MSPRWSSSKGAGAEHDEGERLGEVVVRPGVEAFGLVVLAVLGGEHQDGGGVAVGAHAGADLGAAEAREHEVEQDDVIRPAGEGQFQPPVPVVGDLDAVALGGQALPEGLGQVLFVFDDQDAHPSSLTHRVPDRPGGGVLRGSSAARPSTVPRGCAPDSPGHSREGAGWGGAGRGGGRVWAKRGDPRPECVEPAARVGTPLDRVLIAGIVSHLALAPGECQHSDRQVRHPRRRIDLVATSDS